MKKQLYFCSLSAVVFSLIFFVNLTLAQEPESILSDQNVNSQEEVNQSTNTEVDVNVNSAGVVENEDVTSADLGVSEPKILPDSPWYGLKKLWETIVDSFKINPIKQAERSLDRASERLMEIQGLVDQNKITQERADQLIANYQKHIDKIQERMIKFQDQQSDRKEKFLDKFAEYQLKHQKILDRISEDGFDPEKAQAAKDQALAVLGEALAKTDNEKIKERLEKAVEKIEGGDLKEMKNLEILKSLEEKVPEQAKIAIQSAQVNALKRLKNDINRLPEEQRVEAIKQYIEKIGGDEAMYLEIINDLSAGGELKPQAINEIRKKLQERKQERADDQDATVENENSNNNEAEDIDNENEDANDNSDDESENDNKNGNGNENRNENSNENINNNNRK